MNPEQWLSLKWNGGSTMSDRWLNQSKIIQSEEFLSYKSIVHMNNPSKGYLKIESESCFFPKKAVIILAMIFPPFMQKLVLFCYS